MAEGEGSGEPVVAVRSGVEVDLCGGRGGMAASGHQLRQGRAGFSGVDLSDVAQVVESHLRRARDGQGPAEGRVQVRPGRQRALGRPEHGRVWLRPDESRHVVCQGDRQWGRQGHGPDRRGGLGQVGADRAGLAASDSPPNPHYRGYRIEVDIGPGQRQQLTLTQP